MQYKAATATQARGALIKRGVCRSQHRHTRLPQGRSDQRWATSPLLQPTTTMAVTNTAEIAARKLLIPAAWIKFGLIGSPQCPWSGSSQAMTSRSVVKRKRKGYREEERPPLPDGRDGLARSFMHIANQYPVNLYRRSVNLETTTVN